MLINLTIKQVGGEPFLDKREVEIWRHSRQLLGTLFQSNFIRCHSNCRHAIFANKKKKEGTEAPRSIRNENGEGVV